MTLLEIDPSAKVVSSPARWPVITGLLVFAVLICFERLHTYGEAIERDITGYAVIAHEMLRGRELYSDLWERKPPLLYATFAVAQRVCGYGPGEIFWLNMAAALGTLVAIYFAGKSLGRTKSAGLFAAGLWVVIGGDLYTQANQPNAEVFVNVCLTAAFALLLRWPTRQSSTTALLLGALFTAATMYKQHVVVTCAALSVAHLIGAKGGHALLGRIREMLLSAGVVLGSWAVVAGYFAVRGRFSFFFDALFLQNLSYSGNVGQNILHSFLPWNLLPDFARWVVPMLALAVAAALLDRDWMRQAVSPRLLLWLAWAAGSAVSFGLPGKFFEHYYQLWIPVWCVAGGWATAKLLKEDRQGRRLINRLLVAGAIGCLIGFELGQYLLPSDEWARRKYPRDDFVQERKMGLELAEILAPGQSFYNLGEDTPLYFYSGRPPASGLLYLGPLETGRDVGRYERRLLADLNRSKPDLIVISTLRATTLRQRRALPDWISQNYVPAETNLGCPIYTLMVRPGSGIAGRLIHRR